VEFDALESDLTSNGGKQVISPLSRCLRAIQLHAQGAMRPFRMLCGHLAVESEGEVSVQFFLQLEKLQVSVFPRPGFVHEQHDFAGVWIFCNYVNYIDVFDRHDYKTYA